MLADNDWTNRLLDPSFGASFSIEQCKAMLPDMMSSHVLTVD